MDPENSRLALAVWVRFAKIVLVIIGSYTYFCRCLLEPAQFQIDDSFIKSLRMFCSSSIFSTGFTKEDTVTLPAPRLEAPMGFFSKIGK